MEEKRRRNRRYKLHVRIKKFTRMDARKRTVFMNEQILSGMDERQQRVLSEIRDSFKYNIQMEIA